MKNKARKSEGVTKANLISVVGLVLLGVVIFLGRFYDGLTLGLALLIAFGLTLVFALLLWLMTAARGKDVGLQHWRGIEYAALMVYVAVALAASGLTSRFLTVYGQREALRASVTTDIDAINGQIRLFRDTEGTALGITVTGLQNLVNSHIPYAGYSDRLKDFLRKERIIGNGVPLKSYAIDNFRDKWTHRIAGIVANNQEAYGEAWERETEEINRAFDHFSVFGVPGAMRRLADLDSKVAATLQIISGGLPFPEIGRRDGSRYDIVAPHKPFVYRSTPTLPTRLAAIGEYSPMGIVTTVVCHILVLLGYVFTPRGRILRRDGNDGDDGGRLL